MIENLFDIQGLDRMLWGNTYEAYFIALIVFVAAVIVLGVFQNYILSRLRKLAQTTKTSLDDTFIKIIDGVKPGFYNFLAFYIALRTLSVNALAQKIIEVILIFWVVYLIVAAIQIIIDAVVAQKIDAGDDRSARGAAAAIGLISKIILWSFALLFVLSNLGVNITSLVAGLGIGGIALAFAFQNILEDLFSSFAIYFDKPFIPGDYIVIGEHKGTVQHIGIKTTRIKALTGEELVVSNRELTSTRIQNFKKMRERRIVFGFGVLYETPQDKLEAIADMVRAIIDPIDKARFDRAHFKSFGDSSLDFEVVYYVSTGDYTEYMDIQQEINLALNDKFGKENIGFAYPTRTIYMSK